MKMYRVLMLALAMIMALGCVSLAEEETAETEETSVFEDGAWVTIDAMNADIYLPAGWTLLESSETSAQLSDEEGTSTITISLSDFADTDLETYLTEQGTEYELTALTDTDAAVVTGESDVTVLFVWEDATLVTMVFTPADEGGIADSAVEIADMFYIYEVEETEETTEE